MNESYKPFKPYKPKSKFKKFMNKHKDFIVMILMPIAICVILLFAMIIYLSIESNKCEASGGVNVGQRSIICVKPDSLIDYNNKRGDK